MPQIKIKPTYIILTAILAIAAIYFYQDPQFNGNSRLDAARAVVEQGKFTIDAYQAPPWHTGDKTFFNGHYYTDKAIGSSLYAIPPYFILYKGAAALGIVLSSSFIKHFLTTTVIGSSFVINGLVMYQIALLLSHNSRKALLASLAVSLGTLLWPYCAVYYGHVPAAMFLCVAFYLIFSISKLPEKIPSRRFFWAGLTLGFAFITDYTTALMIAGLLIYALYILRKQNFSKIVSHGIEGAMGALIPLSVMLLYNIAVYGAPFTFYGTPFTFGSAHQFLLQPQQQGNLGVNINGGPDLMVLYHISLDPQFGIFWQSPVLVLAFIGYFIALRAPSTRAEGLVSLFSVASILLINAAILPWWGGSAFGARYLIVALPFFIVPLALLPDSLSWATASLTIISTFQMLIPLMGQIQIPIGWIESRNQFSVEGKPFQGFSILWDYGLPSIFKSLRENTSSWTLGYAVRFLPHRHLLSLPILVGVETFLIGLFYKKTKMDFLPPQKDA